MSRLITFGCSHTRGEGVDDPSTESWPAYLGESLDMEVVNKGVDGVSNKFIQHEVVNFKFQPDDIVAILWTYPDRTCVFKSATECSATIVPKSSHPLTEHYYKHYHTSYNANFESKVIIHQVNSFLHQKYLPVYNLPINKTLVNIFELIDFDYVNIFFSNFLNDPKYRKGHNNHAGHLANRFYAKEIYKHIYTHGQKEK